MRRKILAVHGVGQFGEQKVLNDIRSLAHRFGIEPQNVIAFNWDSRARAPFVGIGLDVESLAELSLGLANCSNIGLQGEGARSLLL